jgi:hypothetical protein
LTVGAADDADRTGALRARGTDGSVSPRNSARPPWKRPLLLPRDVALSGQSAEGGRGRPALTHLAPRTSHRPPRTVSNGCSESPVRARRDAEARTLTEPSVPSMPSASSAAQAVPENAVAVPRYEPTPLLPPRRRAGRGCRGPGRRRRGRVTDRRAFLGRRLPVGASHRELRQLVGAPDVHDAALAAKAPV